MPMDPEIKRLWIQELRSGVHEQGRGVLCTTDRKKCCLGVLTEIARERGVVQVVGTDTEKPSYLDTPVECFTYGAERTSGVLPEEVMRWSGLEDENPVVICEGEHCTLASLNDVEGLTFEEIADIIEADEEL